MFFVSPSDLAKQPDNGRSVRLGGLVKEGSVHRETVDGHPVASFGVTDGRATVRVDYSGILPDLFREGQGVVVLGTLQPGGTFRASEVLAKHDENYMPKEVADALKRSGHWKEEYGQKAAAAPPVRTQ